MPLTTFAFQPGVIKDDTPLAAEGGWINANNVRFDRGKPQTIGGWSAITGATYAGIARGAHQWSDNDGRKWLAWGTATKLFAHCNGVTYDITPGATTGTLDMPFWVDLSKEIATVNHENHGLRTGDSITFSQITDPVTESLAGTQTVKVIDADTYTIPGPGAASFPGYTQLDDETDLGGHVDYTVPFQTGLVNATGTEPTTAATLPRTWSLDNWGQNLIAVPRGGHLYEWQTGTSYPEMLLNGNFASATGWTLGTNWTVGGGVATATGGGGASNDISQFIQTDPGFQPGKIYKVTLTVTFFTSGATTLTTGGSYATTGGGDTVTVTAIDHGLVRGDIVTIAGAVTFNGINPNGSWAIYGTGDSSHFSFQSGQTATTSGTGGGTTSTYSAAKIHIRGNGTSDTGGDLGQATLSIQKSGTYTRYFRAPANMRRLVIRKSRHFAGTIDNVSVALASNAVRVPESPGPAEAMFVDPHRLVVLLGTSLYKGELSSLSARWCDLENISDWTPTNSNMAGQEVLGVGSKCIAGAATRGQDLVWTDTALFTMRYNGDPASVFTFDLAGQGCGLSAPLARAEHNGAAFWMSDGNFFAYQGGAPAPLLCPLRRDVFDNLVVAQKDKAVAAVLAEFSEVWWVYPDGRDGSECSRYVALNFAENHWTCGTLARTALLGWGVFGYPIMFGLDGKAYFHEFGSSANGAALSWSLEAAYADIEDGGNLMFVRRIVPDFDDQVGNVSIDVKYKRWPNASEVQKGVFTATPTTEKIDFRLTARQIKFALSGSANPAFMRLGAIRADVLRSGETR